MNKLNDKSTLAIVLPLVFTLLLAFANVAKANKLTEAISDASITAMVKSKFLTEKDISSFDISVTANNGTVHLAGKVDTTIQFNRVVELASSVHGVFDVDTAKLKLDTAYDAYASDALLTAKAYGRIARLDAAGLVGAHKLRIEAHNGTVHVWGEVNNIHDENLILETITKTEGIKNAKSNLKVLH